MAVKVFLLLISISCLVTSSIGLYSNNNNRRNVINRNCKLLSDCPEFLWLLRNKYDVPGMGFQEVLQYLQSQQCGFDGNDPKVKCPRPNESIIEDPVNVADLGQVIGVARTVVAVDPGSRVRE